MTENQQCLDAVVCEHNPGQKSQYSVIWLHGLGASGEDFPPVIPMLGLSSDVSVRFIFPHAPDRAVTANAGMVMPAWYDITSWDFLAEHDVVGIERSMEEVARWIRHEAALGISPDKIFVVGFSQGGAIALLSALAGEHDVAGVAGLSTYLPHGSKIMQLIEKKRAARQALPLYLAHGIMDPVVPYFVGEQMKAFLIEMGFSPAWHVYSMAHMICLEEIVALGDWMNKRFLA